VNSVNNGGKLKMLKEIVWCEHLAVAEMPMKFTQVQHILLHEGPVYLVVEENKVKLVCPLCWLKGLGFPAKFSREL